MTGSDSDCRNQRVRHLKFEFIWLDSPDIILELPMPDSSTRTRGLYALIDNHIEQHIGFWYSRTLLDSSDLSTFSPLVTLYFRGAKLGHFYYDPEEFSFYWERTVNLTKGHEPYP